MEGIVKDVITSQYDAKLVTRNKFVDVAMVVKQRVVTTSALSATVEIHCFAIETIVQRKLNLLQTHSSH